MATTKRKKQKKKTATKTTVPKKKTMVVSKEAEEKKVVKKPTIGSATPKKSGTSTQTKKKSTTPSTKKATTTKPTTVKGVTQKKQSQTKKTTTTKKPTVSKKTPTVKKTVEKEVVKIQQEAEKVQPVNQLVKYKETIEKIDSEKLVLEERTENWEEATIEITSKVLDKPLDQTETVKEITPFKMRRSYLILNIVLAIVLFSIVIIPVGILFYSFTPGANKNTTPFKTSLGKYMNFGYPIEWTLSSSEDGFSYKPEEDPALEYIGEITEISSIKEKTLDEYLESVKSSYEKVQKVKVGTYDAVMIEYKSDDKQKDIKSYVFYHATSNRRITITLKLEKHDKYTIALLDDIVQTIILK